MQESYCYGTKGEQYLLNFVVHPIFVENGVIRIDWAGVVVIYACDDSFVVTAHIHPWFGLVRCWKLSKIILKEAECSVYSIDLC